MNNGHVPKMMVFPDFLQEFLQFVVIRERCGIACNFEELGELL